MNGLWLIVLWAWSSCAFLEEMCYVLGCNSIGTSDLNVIVALIGEGNVVFLEFGIFEFHWTDSDDVSNKEYFLPVEVMFTQILQVDGQEKNILVNYRKRNGINGNVLGN
jgi:hypothetical protein